MAQLPQQLHALEHEVRTTEQRLQQLKALQPVWVRLEQLQNQELPATLQKVNELEGAAAMGAANVDELATQHAQLDRQVQVSQQASCCIIPPYNSPTDTSSFCCSQDVPLRHFKGARQNSYIALVVAAVTDRSCFG